MTDSNKNKPGKFIRGGNPAPKPPSTPPAKPAVPKPGAAKPPATPPAQKPPARPPVSTTPPQKPPTAPPQKPPTAPPQKPPVRPTQPIAQPSVPPATSIKQGKPLSSPAPAPAPMGGGLGGGAKNRLRPANRVEIRRATMASAPMPPPPRESQFRPVNHQMDPHTANAALLQQANIIQAQFAQVSNEAQMGTVYNTIGALDNKLMELPFAIETLRNRGYVHAGQVEDKLVALENRWDEVRPRVEATLQQHIGRLNSDLDVTERQVTLLRSPNPANVQSANTAVLGLHRQIQAATSAVAGLFAGLDEQLAGIEQEVYRVTYMLDRLQEASDIQLREAEGPLMTVESQWQQNEEDGPNGFLFLTDQRLLFEQREEVVTKTFLGLFTTEKEKIQKLLLDITVADIESITDKEEGGFLGFGKEDILELVCSHKAPVSRARFHLQGQDSAMWAAMIKRVKSGDINNDRAEAYVEELKEAEETAASFPTQCPNCFAEIVAPPRGVSSVTCEFCGTVITPTP